jgi:hypothetical protein
MILTPRIDHHRTPVAFGATALVVLLGPPRAVESDKTSLEQKP